MVLPGSPASNVLVESSKSANQSVAQSANKSPLHKQITVTRTATQFQMEAIPWVAGGTSEGSSIPTAWEKVSIVAPGPAAPPTLCWCALQVANFDDALSLHNHIQAMPHGLKKVKDERKSRGWRMWQCGCTKRSKAVVVVGADGGHTKKTQFFKPECGLEYKCAASPLSALCVASRHAVFCFVVPPPAAPPPAVPCPAVPCPVLPCPAVFCFVVPCSVVFCSVVAHMAPGARDGTWVQDGFESIDMAASTGLPKVQGMKAAPKGQPPADGTSSSRRDWAAAGKGKQVLQDGQKHKYKPEGDQISLWRRGLRGCTGTHANLPEGPVLRIPHDMLNSVDIMFKANLAPTQVWRTLMTSHENDWAWLTRVPCIALLRCPCCHHTPTHPHH